MLKLLKPTIFRLFYAIDAFCIITSLAISWWHKQKFDLMFEGSLSNYYLIFLGIVPLYIIIYSSFDLYTSKRGQNFSDELVKLTEANVIGLILILGLLFALKLHFVSREIILQFFIINIILNSGARFFSRVILQLARAYGYNIKYLAIIGAGQLGLDFIERLEEHREFGYWVRAFFDDDPRKIGKQIHKVNVVGKIEELDYYLASIHIDEVIIALPLAAYQKIGPLVETCEKHGIRAMIIPDYYKYIPAKPKVIEIDDLPLINVRDVPLDAFYNRLLKRVFDIVGSILLIIMLSPLICLIAIGVKLSSPGPVLFKQKRVGLNRKLFEMYKFRSMRISNDEVACTTWTTENDPRRTGLGQFIRASSLDELPQLFNVLRGEMSLIGPRPERPFFVDKFKEEVPKYMVKHQVKPGITGWAQVNGWRGDTSIRERIKCDIYYIENWSLFLDIKILFLTAFKGFINKNAY